MIAPLLLTQTFWAVRIALDNAMLTVFDNVGFWVGVLSEGLWGLFRAVVCSLEAALWASNETLSFEEGCLLAVNLGDRRDTTAAVYDQLAGPSTARRKYQSAGYRSWRTAVSSKTSPKNSSTGVPVQGSPKLVISLP